MSHYAKLATLAIRLAAVAWLVIAVLSFLAAVAGPWILAMLPGPWVGMGEYGIRRTGLSGFFGFSRGFLIVPTLLYLTIALVLAVASKPIGRAIAGDLDG